MSQKYRVFVLLIGLVSLLSEVVFSEQVDISGTAPSYAGTEIDFYTYENYISMSEEKLASCTVDSTGSFNVHFDLEETRKVFSHLGIYMAYFYAEPGHSYDLVLPERIDKTMSQKLNPYFQETPYHLGLENTNQQELNFQIVMFDDYYEPYYNKFAYNINSRSSKVEIDSMLSKFEKPFLKSSNEFFSNYRRYKVGLLKHVAFQQQSRSISSEYFSNQPILYDNPAYMELFNLTYKEYFRHFGRTDYGEKIYTDIGEKKCFHCLDRSLAQDDVLTDDTLREFVILKNLYDEFYKDQFSRSAMLDILDTLILDSPISRQREKGQTIRDKVTKLLVGHAPPAFSLYNRDSTLVSLSDFKGQYVYLNFCICLTYSCIKEFEQLKILNQQHGDKLKIVTIAFDENFSSMVNFLKKNDYDWTFLHYGNQPDIMKEYDIRAYPTYYLIGPDGKLLASPAPSPAENFEYFLFKIMRSRGDI